MKLPSIECPCAALALLVLFACSGTTQTVANAGEKPAESFGSEDQRREQPASDAPSSALTGAPSPATAPSQEDSLPLFEDVAFERVLDAKVRSIALGNDSRVAVLADVPRVFDGRVWLERPVPDAMHPPSQDDRVNIYFGRDNQPRLMGTRVDSDGKAATTYLRLKSGRWKEEPSELGPLASVRGGLYGILGFADPEIVCAAKGLCLIKRLSGWSRTDSDSAGDRFYLTPRGVYSTRGREWFLLEGDQFRSLGDLPFEPVGLCHHDDERVWAVSSDALWLAPARTASSFERQEPAAHFRDVQCDGRHVWAVALEGVFVLEAGTWFRVPHITDISVVALTADRAWLGGTTGLFAGKM